MRARWRVWERDYGGAGGTIDQVGPSPIDVGIDGLLCWRLQTRTVCSPSSTNRGHVRSHAHYDIMVYMAPPGHYPAHRHGLVSSGASVSEPLSSDLNVNFVCLSVKCHGWTVNLP